MTPDNILPKLPKSSLGRLLAHFLFPSLGLRRPDLPIFSVKASLQVVEVRCVCVCRNCAYRAMTSLRI